jgi:hypothetical protein
MKNNFFGLKPLPDACFHKLFTFSEKTPLKYIGWNAAQASDTADWQEI